MLSKIEPRQDELNQFMVEIFGEQKSTQDQNEGVDDDPHLSDEEVVSRIMHSAKAEEIDALFKGDISAYGGDHSADDLAFCNHLAYFSGKDPAIMDRLFRQSRLMRPKWDEMHGSKTYGQMTIEKAIADAKEVYGHATCNKTTEGSSTEPIETNLTIEDLTIVIKTDEETGEETRKFSPSLAADSILGKIPLKFAIHEVHDREKEPDIWICRKDGIWSPDGDHLITSSYVTTLQGICPQSTRLVKRCDE